MIHPEFNQSCNFIFVIQEFDQIQVRKTLRMKRYNELYNIEESFQKMRNDLCNLENVLS